MQTTRDVARPKRALAFVVALILVTTLTPAAVIAAGTFTDVPETHIFFDDIEWMAANGITFGCGGGEYCPSDPVTRGQMSAFMHRLAENQVVDAAALEGHPAGDFVLDGAGVITQQMLRTNSVSAAKIQDDAVGASEIAADAVGASEIAADAVGASEIAAGAVGTSEVANGSLTAVDLGDEAGVAQAADGPGVNIGAGLTTIDTVTIEAPADGFVIVSGTAQINLAHVNGTASIVNVAVMRDSATGFASDEDHDVEVPSGGSTGTWRSVVGMTKAFSVTAGSNSFKLAANIESGANHLAADFQLTAFFVPSAYGTVETSGASVASGEDR